MSRRGNCHDNAVAESFFNLLKRERIRRRVYKTREDSQQDVFYYIEMSTTLNANMLDTKCCHQWAVTSCKNKLARRLGN